jgi:hypothetical protein
MPRRYDDDDDDDDDDRPRRRRSRDYDDDDDDRDRDRDRDRYRDRGFPSDDFVCRECGFRGRPYRREQLSGNGVLVFVLLLLFCLPLCWLPFVLEGCKERRRECPECGTRAGW